MSAFSAYLRRLGYDAPPPPTLEHLRALHRAHLATVPYENLGIWLGRPDSVEPAASVARIGSVGRAGYCFHHNGAFEALLGSLGYAVSRRHGHVWTAREDQLGEDLNHLVLVVSGLPTDDNEGGHWWCDVGLGDGFGEPMPLVRGEHTVDGWRYELGAGFGTMARGRPQGPAAWTFTHDPVGSFRGIVVTSRSTDANAVAASHASLSTGPDSPFRKVLVVQRREGGGVDSLRGCVLQHVTASGAEVRDVTSWADWRAALADVVRLPLDDVPADDLRALHGRVLAAHEAWDAAGRP